MTNITNNMKRKFLTIALTAAAFSVCAQAQEYLPEWQEGYLDIHTIATGRGDAALIVMPDGTTMMIDAGDNAKAKDTQHPDASKMPGEWQAIYIKHFLSQLPDKENLDYAMVTHLHNDHIGTAKDMIPGEHGFGLSGITQVGSLIHFNTFVDRGYPDYDFPSRGKVLGHRRPEIPGWEQEAVHPCPQSEEIRRTVRNQELGRQRRGMDWKGQEVCKDVQRRSSSFR